MQDFYDQLHSLLDQLDRNWQTWQGLCNADIDQINASESFLDWEIWSEPLTLSLPALTGLKDQPVKAPGKTENHFKWGEFP